MKRLFVPIALTALLLAGCGQAPAQQGPSPSKTAVASTTMPSIDGSGYGSAAATLSKARIDYRAVGPDGVTYINLPDNGAVITDINFTAGQEVPKGAAVILTMERSESEVVNDLVRSAKAADLSVRYEYKCSTTEHAYGDDDASTFHAAPEIWKSKDYASFQSCDVEIAGHTSISDNPLDMTSQEESVVAEMKKNGGDVSIPSSAYANVLLACALAPTLDWDRSLGDNRRIQAIAKEAVKMCPKAPFIAELQRVAAGIPPAAMKDGRYIVGKSIQAGTYQIQLPHGANGVSDCYWERTNATGETIENDFITFAPQAPSVTVYDGEGFVTERCGTWKKIG